ncbi:MAG: hypothetical protein AAB656_03810 [Patescibacteria group bacterium]
MTERIGQPEMPPDLTAKFIHAANLFRKGGNPLIKIFPGELGDLLNMSRSRPGVNLNIEFVTIRNGKAIISGEAEVILKYFHGSFTTEIIEEPRMAEKRHTIRVDWNTTKVMDGYEGDKAEIATALSGLYPSLAVYIPQLLRDHGAGESLSNKWLSLRFTKNGNCLLEFVDSKSKPVSHYQKR